MAGTNLLNRQQQDKIKEWVGNHKKFTLLYSATRDGFASNIFHDKCDNKGPTLVVVQNSNRFLFGGYAADSWDSSGAHKNSPGCFLFTLTNPYNIPPSKYSSTNNAGVNAMHCNVGYGPTFGSGHDLYICNNANTQAGSYTNFPHAYADTTGHGNNTFTGARNFTAADVEVFQIN
jgi:hypothetical protein